MTKVDREALQKRIVNFYLSNSTYGKVYTANHFKKEGVCERTIYSIITKYEKHGVTGDLSRSGRPAKMNKNKVKRLENMVNNKSGIGQRTLGSKFGVKQQTISWVLKNKTKIRYYKKEDAPYYQESQKQRVIKNCRKLATKELKDKDVILDDEKYFTYSNSNTPGNRGYYTSDKLTAPPEIRFKMIEKFPPKVLVYLAISSRGISEAHFQESGTAINSDIYIKKCLKSKLLPFIRKYHDDNNYVFWPDLATSHQSKNTVKWLKDNNINFIDKSINPPNVPKARPIEELWAILSDKVYEGGWTANSSKQLIRRIKACIKKIDLNILQTLIDPIRTKLRKIADKGPYSIY